MDKYYLPKTLDVPAKVILWTIDEVVVFLIPFLLTFLLLHSPMIGMMSGAILVIFLKKIKGEEGHYFLAHLSYWHLPSFVRYRATPPSYIRQYLG
jgi:conjugal transfer pilus assembly protein TraL